jgi:tripartite-type tricarboxylate transporter receptor subunit TctC
MRAVLAAVLLIAGASVHAQYPERPVQLIVPWGAGGSTDATARLVASLLEKELKQAVSVVNRTGGSGVLGHQAIASAPADGYTLGMITVEITMMHHAGATGLRHTDYTPIGLVSADAAGIHVRADSPHTSVRQLLAEIRARPGKLRASGADQGGIWHLAIAGLLQQQGIDPTSLAWLPSNGALPGLQHLLAGEVDLVPCSIPEARSMIASGKVRTLAIMDAATPARYGGLPALPTLKSELDTAWQVSAWRVVAAPRGIPADVQRTLVAALKKVTESGEYHEFMKGRGLAPAWAGPEDTVKLMATSDANLGAALKAIGLAR